MNRSDIKREFKERKPPAKGVFALRCAATGEIWVAASANLKATETGQFFMLRNGSHINRKIQAAWNAYGPESFVFEVLETFDEKAAELTLRDLARQRPKFWVKELGAGMV
jgi:hypothetical protein